MKKIISAVFAMMPAVLFAQQQEALFDSLRIDSVVVTARKPLLAFRQTGNIAIDVEQLKFAPLFAGEKDVFKFLQLMPGVSAGKDGMSGLLVRGGSNDQTQILYDDVPVYNQSHTFGLLSIFSGETVSSAEVSKGFIHPAYGSRLSALTRINTRDGDRRQHNQSLTLGTLSLSGTVEGPIVREKGSYMVSGRWFFPEAVLSVMRNGISYGFYDVTGKLSYDIHRNHTLALGLYSGDDHLKNHENNNFNSFGWGNTTASLRLSSRWSDLLRSTAVVYCTYLQNRQQSEFSEDEINNYSKTTFRTYEIGARMSFDHRMTDNCKLEYGADFSNQRFFPMQTRSEIDGVVNNRSYPSRWLRSAAAYLNAHLRYGAFTTDMGLRGAVYGNGKNSAFAAEPRLQIAYNFSGDNAIWASATMNSQALVQFNRYYYSMPIDFWTPFQDGRLQRVWQLTLGGRMRLHTNLTMSVETYYKKMRNLPIIYDSDDYLLENGGFVYGTGQAYGVEAMLQWQTERLSLTASYTYSNSTRRAEGINFPFEYDIPHDFNAFASCDVLKRPMRRHTLTVNASWRSGLPYRYTNEAYPDTDGKPVVNVALWPAMRMRNYFRADISYCMERKKRNGVRTWQISVVNATWHKNPVSIYPQKGGYKATVLIPVMPSVSYSRTFGK